MINNTMVNPEMIEFGNVLSDCFNETIYDLFNGMEDVQNISDEELSILQSTKKTHAQHSKVENLVAALSNLLVVKLEEVLSPDWLEPMTDAGIKESVSFYTRGWK